MVAYADHDDIAEYLGRSLSEAQQTQADMYASAASAYIDDRTGTTWAETSPTTERITIEGSLVYLKNTPVTSITTVTVRDVTPGSAETTLVASVDYELVDAPKGIISLGTVWSGSNPLYKGSILKVTYAHTKTVVPDNIKLATILIASHHMNSSLNPMGQRIRSMNDNRAISITFRDRDIPADALALIPNRRVLLA